MSENASIIPLFPLDILLLPSEQLPLHIFEPRYQQLFKEAEMLGVRMGLPFTYTLADRSFVSICKLLKVIKRYASGESDVIIECELVSPLIEFYEHYESRLYPAAKVGGQLDHIGTGTASPELLKAFSDYIENKYGIRPRPSQLKTYTLMDVAASTAMGNEDKVKWLSLPDDNKRAEMLIMILSYLTLLYWQESKAENGLLLN